MNTLELLLVLVAFDLLIYLSSQTSRLSHSTNNELWPDLLCLLYLTITLILCVTIAVSIANMLVVYLAITTVATIGIYSAFKTRFRLRTEIKLNRYRSLFEKITPNLRPQSTSTHNQEEK